MSDQPASATNTQPETIPCKMGCGFFGNPATGNCCSKCWRAIKPEEKKEEEVKSPTAVKSSAETSTSRPMETEPAATGKLETATTQPMTIDGEKTTQTSQPTMKPKKKKKASYKSMMAGMMEGSKNRDIEKEKESLRKVTGGGNFSKIEKI